MNTTNEITLADIIKFIAGMNQRYMDIDINIRFYRDGEPKYDYHFQADNNMIYGDYKAILKEMGADKYLNFNVENYWTDTNNDPDVVNFYIDIDLNSQTDDDDSGDD